MRKIAIMNNKGGVGKTVTALNLADILSRYYRENVLLVDCDGQMNLTRFFLPEFDPMVGISVSDILTGDHEPMWSDNVIPIMPGLHLLAGSSGLYDLDFRAINDGVSDTQALRRFCEAVADDGEIDYVVFDCPPGFTVASVAALLAADEVVVPMLVDGFSFAGMQDMQDQLVGLHRATGGASIAGVLVTQWHNSEVVRQGETLVRQMGVHVFNTHIRRTDKVPESTFDRQPIVRYSPTSAAARDYRVWVEEYIGPRPDPAGPGEEERHGEV